VSVLVSPKNTKAVKVSGVLCIIHALNVGTTLATGDKEIRE
jgi:hypothetical protein